MTSDSVEVNQVPVIKTIHPRRRILKVSAPEINSCGEGSEIVYDDDVANKSDVVLPRLEDSIDTKNSCVYGKVSSIGRRKEMEDTVSVKLGSVKTEGGRDGYDFFGVYDGHGGAMVAEACKQRLHGIVEEEMRKFEGREVEWERMMEKCFEKMNGEVMKERTVGSTAVVAVVGQEEVVVANCGDSRAVICRSGIALPLSVDHKPDRPDEFKRIEAAGGKVIYWNGHRVLGVLATSRSIGDEYLKPFIICKPEVTISKRTKEDEFLILASDGLWDVMSNEVACQVVKRCLSGRMRRRKQSAASIGRADEAAAVLAELAMAQGSNDNISIIVVELQK